MGISGVSFNSVGPTPPSRFGLNLAKTEIVRTFQELGKELKDIGYFFPNMSDIENFRKNTAAAKISSPSDATKQTVLRVEKALHDALAYARMVGEYSTSPQLAQLYTGLLTYHLRHDDKIPPELKTIYRLISQEFVPSALLTARQVEWANNAAVAVLSDRAIQNSLSQFSRHGHGGQLNKNTENILAAVHSVVLKCVPWKGSTPPVTPSHDATEGCKRSRQMGILSSERYHDLIANAEEATFLKVPDGKELLVGALCASRVALEIHGISRFFSTSFRGGEDKMTNLVQAFSDDYLQAAACLFTVLALESDPSHPFERNPDGSRSASTAYLSGQKILTTFCTKVAYRVGSR